MSRKCKRFRYKWRGGLVSTFALLTALSLAGCGGDGVRLDGFDVRRVGWDTLRVAPSFASSGFGRTVIPDSLTVLVSDAKGRTLYTGYAHRPQRPLVVPVPDPLLGNDAPFMLDLCGYFATEGTVCEQRVLNASPKRLHADVDLDYPYRRDSDQLHFRVAWRQERQQGEGRWQPVPVSETLPARFVIYVDGHPRDAVKIDFDDASGTLDLADAPGYDDFWMRLHDPLLRGDSVAVKIQIDGRLGPRPDSVTTLTRWVAPVSQREREREVATYAVQALEHLLDRLESARDGRAEMEVIDWRFDALRRAYIVRLWTGWRGGFMHRGRFTFEGELTVDEETRRATLRATRLSPDMQRLWYERGLSESIPLGSLDAP